LADTTPQYALPDFQSVRANAARRLHWRHENRFDSGGRRNIVRALPVQGRIGVGETRLHRAKQEEGMAKARSKSGRKSSGGRKTSSKRGGRKTSASARSRTGATRKRAAKRAGSKTSARKSGRKTAARKTSSRRTAGSRARTTRGAARKSGRSSAPRGRKPRAGQILQSRSGESTAGGQLEGEGSYTASRHFRGAQTEFVNRNRNNIGQMGRDAEVALEGPEGNELRAAEEEARSHNAGED